jgi:hypothetical protein
MVDTERTELISKAVAHVDGSHLSDEDKTLIKGRIPFIADIMLKMFVEVCDEDPFGIDAIVKGLKKKLEAQGNLQKLHEIVKQERIEVEELLSAGK